MIPNWLMQRAYLTPEKTALSYGSESWTFEELKEGALQYAGVLKANGLKQGERIALLGPSNAEMVFVIHSCLLLGLEIVMLNRRLTKEELDWQLRDSAAVAVIVADELAELVINSSIRKITFSAIKENKGEMIAVEATWSADRTITIMYTSGTTGFPKGVRQTAENHTSSALSSVLNLGLDEADRWLCTMPLFHISGFSILVRSVLYGMEVKLYEKFDAAIIAKEIQTGSVTRMSVVSVMLNQILNELEQKEQQAHPSFKTMLAGGGSLPLDYLKRAQERGIPVLQTYGMTETSSQTTTLSATDAIRKVGSAGKPLFFNEVKIKDTSEANRHGEIYIRGPHVTPGYIGRFEGKSPLKEGWLPTGDIGYLDEEGYLYIVDRRSDLIISGGENIYPAEIENTLVAHPNIIEAGVCGKENDKWGSIPIAFIVVSKKIEEAEVLAFCQEHLARYKLPKEIHFVEKLPRNASNKLLRRELKKWLE